MTVPPDSPAPFGSPPPPDPAATGEAEGETTRRSTVGRRAAGRGRSGGEPAASGMPSGPDPAPVPDPVSVPSPTPTTGGSAAPMRPAKSRFARRRRRETPAPEPAEFPRGSAPRSGLATGSRSTRRRELPTVTLPRVQVPKVVTATGTRVLDLTTTRLRPLVVDSEHLWRPVLTALRWVSPAGWTVLAMGLVGWWAAARWGWTELALLAVAALVLFLACLALAFGRSQVEITTDVDPVRVTVGDPATGRITVRNAGKRGRLPLLVELPVGTSAARFLLPMLRPGQVHEELFVVPTRRRGVITVGPATTVHGDPLGLVRRTVAWTGRTELFVHPLTTPLDPLGAGLLRDLEGQTTQDLSMSDLAFHALREYQAGDDRRYIHWRSSAKHGRLLVRQFLDTRRSHLAVVVDTTPEIYTGAEDSVELAISVAASLAVRSIMDEQDTTVIVGDQSASRTTASLTLDAMARANVAPIDVFAATGAAAALAPDASVGVLVTGPQRPFIQIRRALSQFDVEVVKVAIIVDPDAGVSLRRLGDVTVLTVRELADLRRVLFSGALA